MPACQFAPLSIEYWSGAVPPVAVTVIEPLFTEQLVGFCGATELIVGAAGPLRLTGFAGQAFGQELS